MSKTRADISSDFVLCRDLTHSWQPFTAAVIKNGVTQRKEIHRVLTCQRCATKRTQRLSSRGEILGNSYSYPQGYVLVGAGRLSVDDRAALRLRSVNEQWKVEK